MSFPQKPRNIGYSLYRSEVLTERDISSLGVRTGGWVEVDVSAAVVVVVAAPGLGWGGVVI